MDRESDNSSKSQYIDERSTVWDVCIWIIATALAVFIILTARGCAESVECLSRTNVDPAVCAKYYPRGL